MSAAPAAAWIDDPVERALARILIPPGASEQPPVAALPGEELTAILPALALGGAERIVVDWAARVRRQHRVHLIALGRAGAEYAGPIGVRITRIEGDIAGALTAVGRPLAASANPVCLCHLLTPTQRALLREAGATPVPVIHNARAGWIDTPAALAAEPRIVAVSQACAGELRAAGIRGWAPSTSSDSSTRMAGAAAAGIAGVALASALAAGKEGTAGDDADAPGEPRDVTTGTNY